MRYRGGAGYDEDDRISVVRDFQGGPHCKAVARLPKTQTFRRHFQGDYIRVREISLENLRIQNPISSPQSALEADNFLGSRFSIGNGVRVHPPIEELPFNDTVPGGKKTSCYLFRE